MSDATLEARVEHLETKVDTMARQVSEIHRALFQGRDDDQGGLLVRVRCSEQELEELRPVAADVKRRMDVLEARLSVLVWVAGPVMSGLVGVVIWLAQR